MMASSGATATVIHFKLVEEDLKNRLHVNLKYLDIGRSGVTKDHFPDRHLPPERVLNAIPAKRFGSAAGRQRPMG